MRKTDQKDQIQKLSNLKTFKSKITKTPIFPNYLVPDGYFDISLQVIYDCSSFVSRYFFVSFSHERKCERIERKIKAQNPNLGLMFSSVSELLALELSSIIVAGLASIEAFSWTEFDDILRGTSGSLAAGGGACSDSESESETEAAEAAEVLRTSAMTSAFWASSRWTVSRFELTISSFVNSSFLIFTQVISYEIGTLSLRQNHNMVSRSDLNF